MPRESGVLSDVGSTDLHPASACRTVEIVHRARDINSLGEAARSFARSSSGRVVTVATCSAAVVRLALGDWSFGDALGVLAVVVALGPVEWIIHRRLLHAEPGSTLAELLGTRNSHERHHRDPDDMEWLLLRRPNAIGSCLAIIAPVALAAGGLSLLGVSSARAIGATVVSAGLVALLHYEWVHLLVHSRYRPRSRYYSQLAKNHRLHHFRNESYWLGVTIDTGDRLARTLPADRSAVPRSETARTLG
jgi:sterol desaturase/sphingolipid hydroxylase (fatty acid hydroxylase superfamily)